MSGRHQELDEISFLASHGQMARRIFSHDWTTSRTRPPHRWPAQLKTLVQIILGSSEPMFVVWGPERTLIYNDPYGEVLANKHPALGRDFLEVWQEVRAEIEPLVAQAYAGVPTRTDDIELVLERKGYPERTHWHHSYTPVRLEDGAVAGFLCACHEITHQISAERRQATLLALEVSLRSATTPRATLDAACEALGRALGGVLATFNELCDDGESWEVTGEWRATDGPSLLGRHRLADWGAERVAHLRFGRPEMIEDVSTDARTIGAGAAAYAALGCRSSLNVPLMRDGRMHAMLTICASEPRRWSPEDLSLATAMGVRTWQALERARAEALASQARDDRARTTSALDALTAHAPIGFAFFDHEHRYIQVNRVLAEINGLPAADHVGRRIEDVLPVNARAVVPVIDRVFRTGQPVSGFEVDGETPASPGEPRSWLTGFFPVFASDGSIAQVGATVVDITDRKRAEAELREREERLRLATEHAEIGFWDVDEINHRLHWPPIVKAMFGISAAVPVTMQDFYQGLHPDDRQRTAAAYAAAADPARRELYDVEYRTVGKEDGVVRWVAAKGRGVFDTHDRCVRVIGTAIDITRRKAAEEQLRELNETLERRVSEALASRKVLADVVDGTDIFVQVADLDYNWLAINRAASREFSRIFGVPPPKAGDNMLALLEGRPEHQSAVRQVWSRALAGEEFVLVDAFGDPALDRRYYEMRYRSLRDAAGRLVGAYQFVADVTERLQEQHRLREAEAALAQMEAVGQLTGGIAHDFNNLLQSVAGSLDLIRRRPADAERIQRWAETGFRAAQRGAKLTSQLLAFSRAQKMELKAVKLSDLVVSFREMIARTIGAHIKVSLDVKTDGIRVLGDEVQIEMAVLNLALNARDAMPDGGEMTISTRTIRFDGDRELPDGDYVDLAVSDTGAGMAPEVMARAFDPFFTTKGLGRGTGLGLSQVYGTMRQAGGSARIESHPGKGTTVRLLFRQTEDAESATADGSGRQQKSELGARVLVVDDDPDVRQWLVESLGALGFHAVEAQDGHAGLTLLERTSVDLMIVDFAMPGLNGAEIAKRVRQSRPGLPIIFATGFADSAALDEVVGADSLILRKPFGMDELRAVIEAGLDRPGDAAR